MKPTRAQSIALVVAHKAMRQALREDPGFDTFGKAKQLLDEAIAGMIFIPGTAVDSHAALQEFFWGNPEWAD